MDAEGLHMNIDYDVSSGVILSTEQKAALQLRWFGERSLESKVATSLYKESVKMN